MPIQSSTCGCQFHVGFWDNGKTGEVSDVFEGINLLIHWGNWKKASEHAEVHYRHFKTWEDAEYYRTYGVVR